MPNDQFFLFRVTIHPDTGEDVLKCVNPEGVAFDDKSLKAAAQKLYDEEAATASPDEGVMIQNVKELVPGVSSDNIEALSYPELAKEFELTVTAKTSDRVS